jgi:hypothetical protein
MEATLAAAEKSSGVRSVPNNQKKAATTQKTNIILITSQIVGTVAIVLLTSLYGVLVHFWFVIRFGVPLSIFYIDL